MLQLLAGHLWLSRGGARSMIPARALARFVAPNPKLQLGFAPVEVRAFRWIPLRRRDDARVRFNFLAGGAKSWGQPTEFGRQWSGARHFTGEFGADEVAQKQGLEGCAPSGHLD